VKSIALVSGLYDLSVGALLFFFRQSLQTWFGLPAPVPPIHVDLNAIFVTAVGVGYLLPYREPERYRGYMWVMGPLLKGAGAAAFVLDYVMRGSTPAFLLFAASDGTLALVTLIALVRTTSRSAAPAR